MKKLVSVLSLLALTLSFGANFLLAQSAPSELEGVFSSSDHAVELRWHEPDATPSSYRVYRQGPDDPSMVLLASPIDKQHNDAAVVAGKLYHYDVTAVYSGNNNTTVESSPTNTIDVFVTAGADSSEDSSHASLHITSQAVTHGEIGQLYQYDVDAVTNPVGQPVCFELHDSPAGMTIDPSTGLIQWTPLQAGMFEVEVRARLCQTGDGEDEEQKFFVSVFSGAAGSVQGVVHNDSGRGLGKIRIRLFDVSRGDFLFRTVTDDSGNFTFPMVNPATYFVRASDEHELYSSQWFDGVQRLDDATPVVVAGNGTNVVNFTLHLKDRSGEAQQFSLSGVVLKALDQTPVHARVTAFAIDGEDHTDDGGVFDDHGGHHEEESSDDNVQHHDDHLKATETNTDSAGHYVLHLNEGTYIVSAAADGFLRQFWNHQVTALEANQVSLHHDTSNIDFALEARPSGTGSISGVIRAVSDSLPVESHIIGYQHDSLGHLTGFTATTETDSQGVYTLDGLPSGGYTVLAFDHGHDIVPTFYSIAGGTPFADSASVVTVSSVAITGVDIYVGIDSVEGLNRVEGEVESEFEGGNRTAIGTRTPNSIVPLGGAIVVVKNASTGVVVGSAVSGATGMYQVPGLAAGSYTVVFQKPGSTTASIPISVTYVNSTPTTATVDAQLASVGSGFATSTMSVTQNWNLVSIPLTMANPQLSAVFPGANSQAFSFTEQGTYQVAASLENGQGYWIQFPATRAIALQGSVRMTQSIPVHAGWNLIGALSSPVNTGAVHESTPGLVASQYFGYENSYRLASALEPGKGYWVKTGAAGFLTMDAATSVPKSAESIAAIEKLNSLTIQSGPESQTLYFGAGSGTIQTQQFEMPPPSPNAQGFDARFASGRMVETHPGTLSSVVSYPMTITAVPGTITVSWSVRSSNTSYRLEGGSLGSVPLSGTSGSLSTIASGTPVKLVLTAGPATTPKEFTLAQNYPNPFNPTTTIAFDLPEAARVSVRVYNILGEEVGTILSETIMDAGTHQATFNANALASGVYFYRIAATGQSTGKTFNDVRKMALIR